MDEIMEKNLKSFAKWLMKQQQSYAELVNEIEGLRSQIDDMGEVLNLAWMLIYDTKKMTDSERVEKIWNAINILFEKYWVYDN